MKLKRYLAGSMALGSLLALSGCGLLPASGPTMHSITSDANSKSTNDSYDLIDLSPENIAQYMIPPERPLRKRVALPEVPEVRLMPGDVLKVIISDNSGDPSAVFAPLATGGTIFDQVRVDSQGDITLPYMGTKKVRGATLADAEAIIRKGVSGRTSEPQVYVQLEGDLSGSVLVAGAVKAPGRFTSLQGPLTVLDAINDAGGATLDPYLIQVVLRTGNSVKSFNYQSLLQGGNFIIPPNSEIVLEHSRKRFVALGAVAQAGLHDFPSSDPSLLEVLGSVGGLNDRSANPSGVFVFRMQAPTKSGEKAKADVFHLDMRQPISMFLAKSFLIQPDDTVFVTNAPVYEMQKIISPIVQVLVLGQYTNQY